MRFVNKGGGGVPNIKKFFSGDFTSDFWLLGGTLEIEK
jgi:hypothetical protein